MEPDVDELLESYSLTRENATDYIRYIVGCNQEETARQIEVSSDINHRYKKAFNTMTEVERAYVIATLMNEHHRDLLHDAANQDER